MLSRVGTGFFLALLATFASKYLAGQDWIFSVQAPPYAKVQAQRGNLQGDPRKGEYWLSLPAAPQTETKSKIQAKGPFGGLLTEEISSAQAQKSIRFASGVIANRDPNPSALAVLPSLCPRLREIKTEGTSSPDTAYRFVYRGSEDRLNRLPVYQMQDPDALQGNQAKTLSEMDGRNVLLLKKVRITYDYEDSNIVDYERIDPKTGERHPVYEGMGGFYSNFHYAIVPYAKEILELPRQTLLNLAQGRLAMIGQERLRPAIRVHAFLPGPFFSKQQWNYSLCEWGDTEYQAPDQSLEYEGIAMWDWDFSASDSDRILLIIWEEDEEAEMIERGLIPKNYLTDDLVGVFEIQKKDTASPLTLISARGDFQITVVTGDLGSDWKTASQGFLP